MTRFFIAYVSDGFKMKKKLMKKLFFNVRIFLEIILSWNFFLHFLLSEFKKRFGHTFLTILRRIYFLNVGKIVNIFFLPKFYFSCFACPSGLCLWISHAIGLKTLVGTDKCSAAFQQKSLLTYASKIVWNVYSNFYFEFWQKNFRHFFINIFFRLKLSETYA